MGTFDVKIAHDGGDVVDRELPEIQRCILGDITGWVASGIVGNATVATGEVTHLGFPTADVRCEFMDEDDRITVATLLEIELGSSGFDIRHRFSPPFRICVVGCRDRKTDRVAIGPTMSSRHCVAWRSIAGVQISAYDISPQPVHAASADLESIVSCRRIRRLDSARYAASDDALAPHRRMVDAVFHRVPTIPTRYVHVLPAG